MRNRVLLRQGFCYLVKGASLVVAIPVRRPQLGPWWLPGGGLDDVPDERDDPVVLSVAGPFDRSVDVVVPAHPCPVRIGVQPGPDGIAVLPDLVGHDNGQFGGFGDRAVGDETL